MTKPKKIRNHDRFWHKEPSAQLGSWLLVFADNWSCYLRYDPLCLNRPYRLIQDGHHIESYAALASAKAAVLSRLVSK